MKKQLHKIATYTALVLISSLPFSMDALADPEKKQSVTTVSSIDKSTSTTRRKILEEKERKIANEANEAMLGTQQALEALEKNDSKKAMSILQAVSGKLDILLAKDPSLALIPADLETDVIDFQGDAKAVEKVRDEADDFLEAGNLQGAREILAGLASEIRITTISIPLGSFPVAIKDAVALIDKGKATEAASVLDQVLNMLVKTTEVIPLPILRAEALLDEAAELEHKKDLSKEKSRAEIQKLTDAAKDKLTLAEQLGYGGKDDYKILYTEIDAIKETLHSKQSADTWEKIKRHLSELKNKVMQTKK